MGKKLGLGWSRALPVMRQKDDILIEKFTVAGVGVSGDPHGVTWSHSSVVSAREHFLLPPLRLSPPPLSPLPGPGSGAAEIKMTPICAAAARLRSISGRESIQVKCM